MAVASEPCSTCGLAMDDVWSAVEDFAVLCIDPETGSIVRGRSPWYIWPDVHPTHLHIPCACLVVLQLLLDREIGFQDGRFVAGSDPGPSMVGLSLAPSLARVITTCTGSARKQLRDACRCKHPRLPAAEAPRFSTRSNPWWVVLHEMHGAGRVQHIGRGAWPMRVPRVRPVEASHRNDTLAALRRAVADGSFAADPRAVGLLVALSACHLEGLLEVDGFHRVVLAPALESTALPPGGHEVLAFMRRASERMSTS